MNVAYRNADGTVLLTRAQEGSVILLTRDEVAAILASCSPGEIAKAHAARHLSRHSVMKE